MDGCGKRPSIPPHAPDEAVARWARWMARGHRLGCHQLPERSLFVRGWQLPVCARCLGILIGQPLGALAFLFGARTPWLLDGAFLLWMFIDWLLQRLGILESTNGRRLATGTAAGFAQSMILLKAVVWAVGALFGR